MATLLDTTFAGSAGANLTTLGWSKNTTGGNTGDIVVRSGGLGAEMSGTVAAVYYRNSLTVTDYEAELTAVLTGPHTGSNASIAILNRMMTADDRWIATIFQGYFGTNVPYALYSSEANGADSGNYLFNGAVAQSLFAAGTYKFKHSAVGKLHRFFVNGYEYIRCRDNATTGLTTGSIGMLFGSNWAAGYLSRFLVTDGLDTDQLVVAGDSLSHGGWIDDADAVADVGRTNVWSALVYQRMLALGWTGDLANSAVGGRTIAEENTDFDTLKATTAIAPSVSVSGTSYGWGNGQIFRAAADKNVAMLFLGTNEALQGVSAATIKSRLATLVSNYKSKGYPVVLGTLIHCDEATAGVPDGFNAVIDSVNTDILAGNPGQDYTVDMTGDARVMEPTLTHRSKDGIHWRPATHVYVADLWEPKVNQALGISGSTGGGSSIGGGVGGRIIGF